MPAPQHNIVRERLRLRDVLNLPGLLTLSRFPIAVAYPISGG